MKKIAAVLFAAVLFAAMFAVPALAIDPFDPNEELSLNLTFDVDGDPATNVRFRLYRVADMKDYGELTYTKEFKDCGAGALVDLTAEQTQKLTENLYSFLLEHEKSVNELLPKDSALTDRYGEIHFPVQEDELLPGLYLLTSERFDVNGESHEAQPFLVCLPYRDANEYWQYERDVMPKLADTQIHVTKFWRDTGYEKKRPESVKVELLQGVDQKVYDTVTLSQKNSWNYTWEDLPAGYKWSVRETPIPDNYAVYIDRVPGGFRVINTYSPPAPPTLPQTGLLWWPVPVLVCVGLLLFVLGWSKQRKKEQ